ncbi:MULTISPECIES: MFS transporter [Streptomyces]|uniref:MFS transporter n=1 Tax=Streptomyces TaxID=1883 RepID=UPI0018858D37|nr:MULTISPECIES: MFS transporter [Streptomyces]MBZ6258318.1 MFS transporter [Streptomyces olivaceus]UOG80557.1 MFS transporter [Streptomyces sp. CB09030]WFB84327.1 MFS transporter [Streptomyces olivaceus]WGK50054.1 MFS transporter [Streptomyces sp. B146]
MTVSPVRRRFAVFALFFLPGLAMASWVTRTPDVRDLLGASTGRMGLVLFGLSVGSMVGILCSGPLVARWGARPVIAAGTLATAAGSGVIGLGAGAGSDAAVALGLALIGLGMGGGEVALNIEGAEVERLLGRSTLPAMHGFYSLGTVVGAVAGMLLTAVSFPVLWHLVVVTAVVLAVLVPVIRYVPAGVGRRTGTGPKERDAARPAVWREPKLLLIGGIILALAMAEGTANDWLPLVMVDGHGFDAALGSAVYAVFAAAMTVGRFAGGPFVDRYGRAAALCASAVVGALGIALVILVDHQGVAAAAAVLWGIGASLGFPVALSAAGDSGDDSAARVSLAATVGYVAFLVGPPSLGQLGEHFGLRNALFLVLALVVAAAFATPAARSARTGVRAAGPGDAPAEALPERHGH